MRGIPFLALDGKVEGFDPTEALVYPLHDDRSHPVCPDLGCRVLVSWRGRWIEALATVGDIVEMPPLPADSETFCLFRNAEEIDESEAKRMLVASGFFPPSPAPGTEHAADGKPPTKPSAPDASGPKSPDPDRPSEAGAKPKVKPPSEKAIQCYRVRFIKGESMTQAEIAKAVYGDALKQYQVHRDLKAVEAWVKAGNVLPDLTDSGPKPKTYTVDPSKLDRGAKPKRRPSDADDDTGDRR
jgi:hypothetical protein